MKVDVPSALVRAAVISCGLLWSDAALAQNVVDQAIYDQMQGNAPANPSAGSAASGAVAPSATPAGPALGQPQTMPAAPQGSGAASGRPAPGAATAQPMPPGVPVEIPLFGSQLFAQPGLIARLQPTNTGYLMDTGDRIALNLWGGLSYSGLQTIDGDGNIFVPEVGPVRLRGRPSSELNAAIRNAAQNVFTSNVGIYATLLSRQPTNVFVTGAVRNPGRFAGERKGSLISFLASAGGIDPESGSYRDIRILRGDQQVARIDLYNFLLNGTLPAIEFQDDDTILVGQQGTTVTVQGEARNPYRFEIDTTRTIGRDLTYFARPKSGVSYVAVTGTRDGVPYSAYLAFDAFLASRLENGDQYTFVADGVDQNIFVSVTGQSAGSSQLAVPKNARLGDVLKQIEVDPQSADVESIYLRRRSAAEQQAQALQLSLNELQRAVLTAPAASEGDVAVRVQEANMVQQFVQEARNVRPEGRVVLAGNPNRLDTMLEPGDEIVIPPKDSLIMISGEVRLPQTVLYRPGKRISDYADDAGGFTARADTSNFVVIRRSGAVELGGHVTVKPGDNIMVMPEAGTHDFVIFKEIVGVLYQIAISTAATLRAINY
jgi:protein involved in polysaccharide export with SLBB domain